MSSLVQAVLRYWDLHDVDYLPGNSEDEIRHFEERAGFRMPLDMHAFFLATDGTHVDGTELCDHNSFYFWPLRDVNREDGGFAFEFADYQESSWRYGIDLAGDHGLGRGIVYLLYDRHGHALPVAPSFGAFLAAYLDDDERLYLHGATRYRNQLN